MAKKRKGNLSFLYTDHGISDVMQEGVFSYGSKNGILECNARLIYMLGFISLAEISHDKNELFADDEARTYILDKIEAHGSLTSYRVRCRKKDGRNFWAVLNAQKIYHKNELRFNGTLLDLSAQVKTETQLMEAEIKMEKISMELDRFIYSASHDIRSPISTMLGILNLIRMDNMHVSIKEYIAMMDDTIKKLDHIVTELTAHGKNSKKASYDAAVNFEILIKNIQEEFRQSHSNYDSITFDVKLHQPNVFYADVEDVKLIFSNIIKNALDYCDKKKIYTKYFSGNHH